VDSLDTTNLAYTAMLKISKTNQKAFCYLRRVIARPACPFWRSGCPPWSQGCSARSARSARRPWRVCAPSCHYGNLGAQVTTTATWHISFFKLRFWLGRVYPRPSPGQYKQLCKRKGGLIRPAYGRGPTSQALKWAHICALEVPCSALFVLVGM
jgi:hypothetical protein